MAMMEPCGCPQWSAATRDEDRGLKLVRGVAAGVDAREWNQAEIELVNVSSLRYRP